MVDWQAAAEFAARVAPPGPIATHAELSDLVAGLRQAAATAIDPVLATTQMTPVTGFSPVYVVDRARWVEANTQMMAAMTAPLAQSLAAHQSKPTQATQLVSGLQAGALLAALSSRVLGQFDPYAAADGRLLLVAPNVLRNERQMGVDPHDFRLWVCLHEQTHALQFAAAPWLAEHMQGRIGELMSGIVGDALARSQAPLRERLALAWRTLTGVLTGVFRADGPAPFERLMTPEQRAELAEITAVMALLEGHADVIMDDVGPSVVPSVAQIRAKFEKRRDGEGASRADALLRRLIGMDAKLAQYRDGAMFVRGVEERVGREGFNAIWASPDTLPRAAEIADPAAWITRLGG